MITAANEHRRFNLDRLNGPGKYIIGIFIQLIHCLHLHFRPDLESDFCSPSPHLPLAFRFWLLCTFKDVLILVNRM